MYKHSQVPVHTAQLYKCHSYSSIKDYMEVYNIALGRKFTLTNWMEKQSISEGTKHRLITTHLWSINLCG